MAGLKFAPRRFDSFDKLRAAMFRESMLENFHERLLFFYCQVGGGIQYLRKLRHCWKLPSGGNGVSH